MSVINLFLSESGQKVTSPKEKGENHFCRIDAQQKSRYNDCLRSLIILFQVGLFYLCLTNSQLEYFIERVEPYSVQVIKYQYVAVGT